MSENALMSVAAVQAAARRVVGSPDLAEARAAAARGARLVMRYPSSELLCALALKSATPDLATITTHAAIVSAAMARDLEAASATVLQVVDATFILPLARRWLAESAGVDLDVFRSLPEPLERKVACLSAAAALGSDEASRTTACTAYEAAQLVSASRAAPYDGARAVLPRSMLVAAAWSFAMRCNATEVGARVSSHEVLKMMSRDPMYTPWVNVLARVVGQYPVGSVVVLEDKSWAVVAGPPEYQPDRPPVRRVTDEKGRALNPAPLWDLGKNGGLPKVAGALDPALCRFNAARALFQDAP
ncbi:MAG: hypothetical protein R3B13_15830 [Polyangiaceae bacterium]